MNLFEKLWQQYIEITPSAGKIHTIFESRGEKIVNDHIAIRTFSDPRVDIHKLSKPFLAMGYEIQGEYRFEEKKLQAIHLQIPAQPLQPKIFISQLQLNEFSEGLRSIVKNSLDQVEDNIYNDPDLLVKGRLWGDISFSNFQKLRAESEYAAWMYAFGYRANHFTVNVNELTSFGSLQEVNSFLEENGFKLNESGGKIKGSPEQLLEQSSILADLVDIQFNDGEEQIPSCYYEFARRYPDTNGKLYQGFIASSADKIFESTDVSQQS